MKWTVYTERGHRSVASDLAGPFVPVNDETGLGIALGQHALVSDHFRKIGLDPQSQAGQGNLNLALVLSALTLVAQK